MRPISALLAATIAALAAPATAAPLYTYAFESSTFVPGDSDYYAPDPTETTLQVTLVIDEARVPGGTLRGATIGASDIGRSDPLPDYVVSLDSSFAFPEIIDSEFEVTFDQDRQVTEFLFDAFRDPEYVTFTEVFGFSTFFDSPFFDGVEGLSTDGPSTATLVSVAAVPLPASAALLAAGLVPFAAAAARRRRRAA